jgi:PKD repeat protein
VTSLECDPSDELLRQTGGVSPKAPTHFHYATSGSNRGRFAQIGYDDTGILPAGVNGFAYGFISDNGSAPDEAADDGRYADGWVWIRDEFTGDAFYARGIISSTDRTAAFSEYRIDVRDPDPAHASFVADVTSGAAPLTVTFTDQSNGDVSTRNWDFDGDGYVDAANPDEPVEYTYASSGVYSVSLEVSGPLAGSDAMTRTDYIEVFQSVQSDFTADPTSGEAPLTVTFTDLSTGDITNREWDFDGDGVADAANPSAPIEYTYAEPGVYDVTLTVTGPPGTDYETKAEYVEVIRKTGDVNGDNAINAIDIQLVILGIFKLDTGGHDPDVNGDGQVNAVDVQMTILALFGLL